MVVNLAQSAGSAGVLVEAGINTVLAPAGLVQRTLWVTATSYDLTGGEWISFISRQTSAVGSVAGGVALGKPSTGISSRQQAGVDTFSLHTGLSVPAVVVTLTAGQLAPDLRVADVAWRTGADWVMVLDKTLGSGPTVTGVFTLSVNTGLAIGTVVIPGTAGRVG